MRNKKIKFKISLQDRTFLLSQFDYLYKLYDKSIDNLKTKIVIDTMDSQFYNDKTFSKVNADNIKLSSLERSQTKLLRLYSQLNNMKIKNNSSIIVNVFPEANKENEKSKKIIYGKDEGLKKRKELKIKKLEKKYNKIILVIPHEMIHITISFFTGFLQKSIKKYKNKNDFMKKFILKTDTNTIEKAFYSFVDDNLN